MFSAIWLLGTVRLITDQENSEKIIEERRKTSLWEKPHAHKTSMGHPKTLRRSLSPFASSESGVEPCLRQTGAALKKKKRHPHRTSMGARK